MNWPGADAGDGLIAARAIHFAASAMIAGVLAFRMLIAGPGLHLDPSAAGRFDSLTVRIASTSLAICVGSGTAWLLLQAAAMSGLAIRNTMTADVIGTVMTETRFGFVLGFRCFLAVVLAVGLALDRLGGARWLSLIAALGLVGSLAWSGHAGSTVGGLGLVHLTADVLHVVAASTWIGGVVSLLLLFATISRDASEPSPRVQLAAQRFSILGIVSVLALLVSGALNATILVGSLDALFATFYGRLLILKIALFAMMLLVATANRFWLTPRLAQIHPERGSDAVRQLVRNGYIEIALGMAIFAIVGALGTLHPSSHLASIH